MLGKQKMTRLTPPRIGLVKMSSTMLYRAKKREIRGRRPSVKIESMVERYLPLLAPVLSRISSPSKFAEDNGDAKYLFWTSSKHRFSKDVGGNCFIFKTCDEKKRISLNESGITYQLIPKKWSKSGMRVI